MARVTFIYYPLLCRFGCKQCTACKKADEISAAVYCDYAVGFDTIPKVLVKQSNSVVFDGVDLSGNWNLKIDGLYFNNLTSSIKLLMIDDVVIYSEPEEENIDSIIIKYHNKNIEELKYIDGKSDWIDLRSAEDVFLKKGEYRLISLGISVKLPAGYEMIIAPRSSTFKNFGILQTNSIGVIDESYCGDDDIIKMPVLAVRDTEIKFNDRICQFRIQKHQPAISFEEVDFLGNKSRNGFGSTGIN